MSAVGVTRIDRRFLEEQGACKGQIELFDATFPDGAELRRANLLVAALAGLDVAWLAEKTLLAPAWRTYEEAIAMAWRAYGEAGATARRAFDEAIAMAWRAYDEAIATAWRAYEEATATALADALGLD